MELSKPTADYIRALSRRFNEMGDDALHDQAESYANIKTCCKIVLRHAKGDLLEAEAGLQVIEAVLNKRAQDKKGESL